MHVFGNADAIALPSGFKPQRNGSSRGQKHRRADRAEFPLEGCSAVQKQMRFLWQEYCTYSRPLSADQKAFCDSPASSSLCSLWCTQPASCERAAA